jgi:hypothetical protein
MCALCIQVCVGRTSTDGVADAAFGTQPQIPRRKPWVAQKTEGIRKSGLQKVYVQHTECCCTTFADMLRTLQRQSRFWCCERLCVFARQGTVLPCDKFPMSFPVSIAAAAFGPSSVTHGATARPAQSQSLVCSTARHEMPNLAPHR